MENTLILHITPENFYYKIDGNIITEVEEEDIFAHLDAGGVMLSHTEFSRMKIEEMLLLKKLREKEILFESEEIIKIKPKLWMKKYIEISNPIFCGIGKTSTFYKRNVSNFFLCVKDTLFNEKFNFQKDSVPFRTFSECDRLHIVDEELKVKNRFSYPEMKIEDDIFICSQEFVRYSEWIVDILPRIFYAKDLDKKLLIPKNSIFEFLEILSIPGEKVILSNHFSKLLQNSTFLSIPSRGDFSRDEDIASIFPSKNVLECYSYIREKFNTEEKKERIFLEADAVKISNKEKFYNFLQKNNFLIVSSSISVSERLKIINKCKIMISASQERLTDLVFIPDESKIIYISPCKYWLQQKSYATYKLSCMKNDKYFYYDCGENGNFFNIDIPDFEIFLRQVLNE